MAASTPSQPSSRRAAAGVAARLLGTPSFWLLSFGAASGSILGYGLIFWLPSFFNRSFGLALEDVGWFYGSIVLVGGALGTWLGGSSATGSAPRGRGAMPSSRPSAS